MGSLLVKNKGSIFPPIGFPDKIQIGDGIYEKVIGSIVIPPFANFNQGLYYVKDNTYYLGPINTDVRWLFVDNDSNLLGITSDISNDRLPYNNFDWSNPPAEQQFITLPKGGKLDASKTIVTYLESSTESNIIEYTYKNSPLGDPLIGDSTLINLFDPTADYGVGENSAFTFYDGSINNNTASNYIDVYSDGSDWRDYITDEIANDIEIPKGKNFIFYMLDIIPNIIFPISSDYIGIQLTIQKLRSGSIQTDPPIPIIANPPLVSIRGLNPNELGPSTPSYRVLVDSDEEFAIRLSEAGYEINSYKQFIFDTYGINIDFNIHFIVLESALQSLGGLEYSLNDGILKIAVGVGIIAPADRYFGMTLFLKEIDKYNTVKLFYGTYNNQIDQINF